MKNQPTLSKTLSRRTLLDASACTALAAMLPLQEAAAAIPPADPWERADWIVRSIRATSFPDADFPITRFGARPVKGHDNGKAIAAAIAAAHDAGGGRVIVPAGTWESGAIHLKSNVNLHVQADATILFSTRPQDYPIVFTRWEGMELMNYSPLVYAHGQENVALTGAGTLDGQAGPDNWWSWKGPWNGTVEHGWKEGMADQRPARARLFQMAEANAPPEKRIFGEGSYLRPAFVQFYACDRVLIEGVKLRRSPFWQVHPVLCRNVVVRGVDIHGLGPNNDGCDPESVDMMLIEQCTFDTGDDCIAVNSGRNADGRRLATPAQNIVIRDCRMKEGHGGVVVGSQISGGARHIYAERCTMDSPDLWYAIRFKNNALRGGLLEHFYFRDLTVGQVSRAAITCDFNYEEGADGPFKPVLRDILIQRMTVAKAARVLDSQGLPGAPVGTLRIEDSRFDGVTHPSILAHSPDIRLSRVRVNGAPVQQL
ncbi:glycoside hydrolase family 28 protein [Sphingobium sp. JS3065]|uniref:glycoside hydrolase family 28 protein n=1 Tax=Sphingobium sp. JS3065 TaxID=2970925 RepID=UPI002263BF22|nr:glycoside hydrolase family 28 protein [Sphingobium sp. JS3065]UZW57739.1 glycoside hydrolase family 28 protein [Sphingobium sp. JS3065]